MSIVIPGCGLIGTLLVLVSTVFWIWMIVDCVTSRSLTGSDKIVWLLVIIFLHFVGALIYYLVGRKRAL
jgi:hypothetical protein